MIAVGIVEDDEEVRQALSAYCGTQEGLRCVIAAGSAEIFFERLRSGQIPDVVLMDIGLPGMSGIAAIRLIKERYPSIDVIMLTIHMDAQKVFESLRAGASGYLLKTTPFAELISAIQEVHSGGAAMSPQIARKVLEFFRHNVDPPSGLTPREREIVQGLVDGLSYKLIAARLDISHETVRTHIKSIYQKLHTHSKTEVITRSLNRKP